MIVEYHDWEMIDNSDDDIIDRLLVPTGISGLRDPDAFVTEWVSDKQWSSMSRYSPIRFLTPSRAMMRTGYMIVGIL